MSDNLKIIMLLLDNIVVFIVYSLVKSEKLIGIMWLNVNESLYLCMLNINLIDLNCYFDL